MAYAFRINQKVTRNITIGNCFTGLKYLKVVPPPISEPNTTSIGCRTTSKTAVRNVDIVNLKLNKSKKSEPSIPRELIPIVETSKNGNPRICDSAARGVGKGRLQERSSGSINEQRDEVSSFVCSRFEDVDAAGNNGQSPTNGGTGTTNMLTPGTTGAAVSKRSYVTDFSSPAGVPPSGSNPGGGSSLPPGGVPPGVPPGGVPPGVPPAQPPPTGGGVPTGSPMIRPPTHVPGIAGSYAAALYSAASKQGKLELVEQDLIKIRDTYIKDTILQKFLMEPDVPIPLKIEGMQALKKLNISDLCFNMLVTLAQNRRLTIMPNVIAGYLDMMAAHRGIVECEIISARPLKPEQKEKLLATLVNFLPGKTANTIEKLDPSIIGGFIIMVGERHIDMSMRKVVNKYESLITEPT